MRRAFSLALLICSAGAANAQNWIQHRVTTDLTTLTAVAASADFSKLLVSTYVTSTGSGQSGPTDL
jgi:hypothetical protein